MRSFSKTLQGWGGPRRLISGSAGRKPNTHWVMLAGLFVGLVLVVLVVGALLFWTGADTPVDELASQTSGRSFNKSQFETVLKYFEERAARFERVKATEPPVDPS